MLIAHHAGKKRRSGYEADEDGEDRVSDDSDAEGALVLMKTGRKPSAASAGSSSHSMSCSLSLPLLLMDSPLVSPRISVSNRRHLHPGLSKETPYVEIPTRRRGRAGPSLSADRGKQR